MITVKVIKVLAFPLHNDITVLTSLSATISKDDSNKFVQFCLSSDAENKKISFSKYNKSEVYTYFKYGMKYVT